MFPSFKYFVPSLDRAFLKDNAISLSGGYLSTQLIINSQHKLWRTQEKGGLFEDQTSNCSAKYKQAMLVQHTKLSPIKVNVMECFRQWF